MGNKKCTPPRPIVVAPPRQQRVVLTGDREVRAMRSISNPSLQSQAEDDEVLVETSISQQFDAVQMDAVYAKYQAGITSGATDVFVPAEVTKALTNVLETIALDENVLFLSMKFHETLLRIDDTWNGVYSACADRNPIKYAENRGFAIENRMTLHIMLTMRTFKLLLSAYEDGRNEVATEILSMLALSHLIMHVQPAMFNMYLVRLIKSLIHCKILNEELLPSFIYFHVNVLREIEKQTAAWEHSHPWLLDEMKDGLTAPSREYFRELKKWKTFVFGMYKALAKPIQQFEKQLQVTPRLEQITPNAETRVETWKIIRLLKRGYKYREKVEAETYF